MAKRFAEKHKEAKSKLEERNLELTKELDTEKEQTQKLNERLNIKQQEIEAEVQIRKSAQEKIDLLLRDQEIAKEELSNCKLEAKHKTEQFRELLSQLKGNILEVFAKTEENNNLNL